MTNKLPTLNDVRQSIIAYQNYVMINENPEDLYYKGVMATLDAVLKLMDGNQNEIQ